MKLPPKNALPLKNHLAALEQRLGPIEMRPVVSLPNYARNPRRHPERQIVALEASMRQFGFTIPLVVDSDGVVIAGEGRLQAARRIGMTEVPVLVAHHWTRAQIKAYRLVDNRLAEHATWDKAFLAAEILEIMSFDEFSVDLLGWETAEIDVILEEARETEEGEQESADPADVHLEPPTSPVTRAGDVWLLGKHRTLCASSLDDGSWERLMSRARGAMAFTDPPFNVPIAGHVCGLGKNQHSAFAAAGLALLGVALAMLVWPASP